MGYKLRPEQEAMLGLVGHVPEQHEGELYAGITPSQAGLGLEYDPGTEQDPTQRVQQHLRGRAKLGQLAAAEEAVDAGADINYRYNASLRTGPLANGTVGHDVPSSGPRAGQELAQIHLVRGVRVAVPRTLLSRRFHGGVPRPKKP